MKSCEEMVMIGAAGRNVGKTEFACRLISRYSEDRPVIGVKITTVEERDGQCPRGGSGCGVCSALEESYCLTEEIDGDGGKDTERMIRAGADKVFWLRVLKQHLDEGIEALIKKIPAETPVVCESNSARLVLEPGVFLVVREKDGRQIKPSCSDVADLADVIVNFDGSNWDLPPERVVFFGGKWRIRPEACAVILAGGASSRMGQNKAMMEVEGSPLIGRIADQLLPVFDEVVIGADDADRYSFAGLRVIPDEKPGCGPLMGIVSCLRQSVHDLNFVVGCDIPDVNVGMVLEMLELAEDSDIVMPRLPDGKTEPLFAVYSRRIIEPAERILERGGRRIVDLFDETDVAFIEMKKNDWYCNLNTIEEFRARFGRDENTKENPEK